MPSAENRPSAALADPAAAADGAGVAPNPPLVCPKMLLLPAVVDSLAVKPVPNPPPPPLFAVEEKLNPEAEPNPEEAAGALEVAALKENEAAEGAEEAADEEEPNPEGGCVGTTGALPKPAEEDGAAVEPNPLLEAAKLNVLAWTGAPNPTETESFIKEGQQQWTAMSLNLHQQVTFNLIVLEYCFSYLLL